MKIKICITNMEKGELNNVLLQYPEGKVVIGIDDKKINQAYWDTDVDFRTPIHTKPHFPSAQPTQSSRQSKDVFQNMGDAITEAFAVH